MRRSTIWGWMTGLGFLLSGAGAVLAGTLDLPAVLFFVRTDCPISNRYAPVMQRLADRWSPRGYSFYLVYPVPGETTEAIETHRREHGLTLPWLRDEDHAMTDRCSTRVTPESALLSAEGKVLYHGRIDDRWVAYGKARSRPTRRDLEEGLETLARGAPITEPSRKAVGCPLPSAGP